MDKQYLIDTALSCGAAKAAVIEGSAVVLSASFRDICKSNGCGNYGRCWVCPPFVGEIEDLMARVRSFPQALLYQTISEIEDSYDIEGMFEAGKQHALMSQRLQKALKPQFKNEIMHLSCGGCHLCERCAKKDELPCRHPGEALGSMEGAGIDVYNTCKPTELKYINGQDTVTYFGIVLFSE